MDAVRFIRAAGNDAPQEHHLAAALLHRDAAIADMLILIDGGKIIFQQSKDDLLDTFRIVKGNTVLLNDQNRKLIRSLKVSSYGFTGITDQAAEVKKEMPDVLLEKATIEDIMLAYIGGENDDR